MALTNSLFWFTIWVRVDLRVGDHSLRMKLGLL